MAYTHTHTLASKAGSDNRAGLDIEQGAWLPGRTCTTASLAHTRWTILSAYTHWTGRLAYCVPVTRTPDGLALPWASPVLVLAHTGLSSLVLLALLVLVLGVPWADSLGIPALSGSKFPAAPQP